MKYIFFLFLTLFTFKETKAQYFDDIEGVIGIGAGPETIRSAILPKFGAYKFDSLGSFQNFYGIEATVFIVGAVTCAADITYGLKKGPFTLETSVAYWFWPGGNSSHLTINPKIGLKFFGPWFRFGPSFVIHKKYGSLSAEYWLDDTEIGGILFNFEILFSPQAYEEGQRN